MFQTLHKNCFINEQSTTMATTDLADENSFFIEDMQLKIVQL